MKTCASRFVTGWFMYRAVFVYCPAAPTVAGSADVIDPQEHRVAVRSKNILCRSSILFPCDQYLLVLILTHHVAGQPFVKIFNEKYYLGLSLIGSCKEYEGY